VLYCEPAAEERDRLVLTYKGRMNPEALIDVRGGTLEMVGVSLKLENNIFVPHPQHLIRVRGGDLRMSGCRLTGPLGRVPKSLQGLIGFEGSGEASAARAHECAIAHSLLAAGNTCVHSPGV